jgi:hypothetical protein
MPDRDMEEEATELWRGRAVTGGRESLEPSARKRVRMSVRKKKPRLW